MSIAGIAKEVTTIAASAIVFGDELTPLNITGVGITIAGKFFPPHATLFLKGRLIRAIQVSPCIHTTNIANRLILEYRLILTAIRYLTRIQRTVASPLILVIFTRTLDPVLRNHGH